MFKNLKEKIATQVTKTNQTLYSAIISNDSGPSSRDSGIRTPSISSRDENVENNRSRLDSTSSDISQTATYIPPLRQFTAPSDIESEFGGDETDHETNNRMEKLLEIYKNKFTQLKNAYVEVEHENNQIKDVLQKTQDTSIKRQTELREKIKLERQTKEQFEKEIKLRDHQIEEFTQQLTTQKDLVQSDQEEIRTLREKNTKIETLLARCKEAIKNHQEKQIDLVKERDDLFQQLNEKQTFIESIMKDRHSEDPSGEVKEHFDSDISVLLHDKERLQEQLESTHLCVRQLETDLELAKQQQQLNEDIKHERDEFKQKYENLLNLEIINKDLQETILKDKQQIEIFKQNLVTEKEQDLKSFDTLKTEYENLTNELHQTKLAKDDIQSLLDQTMQEQTIYKDKYEQTQQHEDTDNQIDELKASLTKLQHDYDESLANCTQLTQTLDTQRQEYLKELHEENDRIKSEFENTYKEQLSAIEDELQGAAKRSQDKITDLSSQINERQEEINHLQQLLDEQKNNSNQYEEELKQKSSQIIQLEQDLEKSKSQKELIDEYNLLQKQLTLLQQKFDATTKQLQNELDEKTSHVNNMEEQLEVKQNEIVSLNATIKEHEQFRETVETTQSNDRQSSDKMINTLKQDHQLQIEELNKEHQKQQEEIDNLHQQLTSQLNEKYSQLETKLNNILSEKSELENELDSIRLRMQTTESTLNDKTNDHSLKLEQTIKEFETERDSYRNEIETLKSEIISLVNINEENTHRIDEFDNEKFNFEQEINEKNQEITKRDEEIQEFKLALEQTKESGVKLRKPLQNMKESVTNNGQTNSQDPETRLRKITEEYEERLKEQEIDYDSKLKAMAKEMSVQIDDNEQKYNQQLRDFIQKSHKTENDLINNSKQKVIDAEQRALITEKQIWKMEEDLKEKQLDHYRIVHDLQIQIQKLTREKPETTENSSQTTIEDLNRSSDSQHSLVFEPTEVDYLKQIILAYMTGTDRITMAKVICAVLRYTDDEKSLIIEQEKLRQSRWLNSTR